MSKKTIIIRGPVMDIIIWGKDRVSAFKVISAYISKYKPKNWSGPYLLFSQTMDETKAAIEKLR
ncbi:hypothetical protein LCGC14_2301310 [marine sediment metagenome]|uniref:Uncharacterized protein n=1 Tax=marine sediment metagenome TaxID=412755 RepID=A0A0F9CNF3_9ZZZZ